MRGLSILGTILFALHAAKPEATLWVAHEFMGGPKCVTSGPVSHYNAPGFEAEKAKLKLARVRVFREFFRDKATCEACRTCPNYHREILFEIRAADGAAAEKAGYRKALNPPTPGELQPPLPDKESDHGER